MENAAILPTPPAVASHADFADWLSPMLVKELRQGVRTRLFVAIFILLQVAMLLDLSLSLLVAANHLDASEGTVFFWIVVSVPTLLVVPFTGLGAINSEVRANTLELIFLTRLTTFRIVFGKWLALFSQSLLLVCATLPYLVLRYFMGGVNLAGELLLLFTMLIGSALLIAATVGLSAFPTRVIRPLAAVGGIFLFFAALNIFFDGFLRSGLGSTLPSWTGIGATLVWSTLLVLLTIHAGAIRIAPPAENHAGVMRALTWAGLALAVVLELAVGRYYLMTGSAFVVAVGVCAVAVCEQPRAVPSVYRPFVRWGLPGRIVGRLFYPGWPAGVLFTLVTFAAFGWLFWKERLFEHSQESERFVATLGTLLFPAALAHTVLRRWNRPVVIFLLTLAAAVVVLIFFSVCDNALGTELKNVATCLPFAGLLAPWAGYYWDVHLWTSPVAIVTALSALAAFVASLFALRPVRVLERASLDLPEPPRSEPAPHVPVA